MIRAFLMLVGQSVPRARKSADCTLHYALLLVLRSHERKSRGGAPYHFFHYAVRVVSTDTR